MLQRLDIAIAFEARPGGTEMIGCPKVDAGQADPDANQAKQHPKRQGAAGMAEQVTQRSQEKKAEDDPGEGK
jgi:hypothetical protein